MKGTAFPRFAAAALMVTLLSACGTTGMQDEQAAEAAELYVQLGAAYMREGQLDVAQEKLRHAVQIDPDNSLAHSALGVLYERLGDHALAEQHYQSSVGGANQDPLAENNYGAFLCRLGRYAEAEKHFLAAAKNPLYDSPAVAYSNAGNCARRIPDLARAERYFRSALKVDSKLPAALLGMAKISQEAENYLSSRAYLQRYLEVSDHTAETLWLGIVNERALGDQDVVASYSLLLKATYPDSEQTGWLLELERNDAGIHH